MLDRTRLEMGAHYAASYLAYALDGAPHPFSAAFNVTDRCNLRCTYCNFQSFAGPELDLAGVAQLFDRLKTMGIRRLGLVGGEPLIRTDIGQVIGLARDRGFFISVSSNLTLFHRFPGVLQQADLILTSLDGESEAHEANRGAGSSRGVIDAIRALVATGKTVVGICVVRHGTLEDARRLLAQARTLGIRMHFQMQCLDAPITRGTLPDGTTDAELRQFWRGLLRLKAAGEPVASSIGYLETLAQWPDYRASSVADPAAHCVAGRGFLFIDPMGNAFPCTVARGQTTSVNLLNGDWQRDWDRSTPCSRCTVGPMLEFNLLFQHPVQTVINAVRSYG